MPIYKGGSRVEQVYKGSTEISEIYKGDTLVFSSALALPTKAILPSSYTEELVSSTSANQYKMYTVPESGFYRVQVMGASGGRSRGLNAYGSGGLTNAIVYLYKGSKCLLWSGSYADYNFNQGLTGYPTPNDSLGGMGATGTAEGGGGGGGASNHGRPGSHWEGGSGGGGSGFLAGIDIPIKEATHRESAWSQTISSLDGWNTGSFSVNHLYVRVLAGGGGGSSSDNGSYRAGGGGGGAWGNGGNTSSVVTGRTSGPGGSWGQGNSGGRYSGGAAGAYAVLDFSTNQWRWGTGGGAGAAHGFCRLYKIIPN